MRDGFPTLSGASRAELREKGSRFLAIAEPVADEAALKRRCRELSETFADATHVCWAARLGWPPVERCTDAGEPRGTAGPPILRTLVGAGLSDTLVAVVRWFGGTKLGKGGLARAYAEASRRALSAAPRCERIPRVLVDLECSYEQWGAIQRLVHPPVVSVHHARYHQATSVTLAVERSALESLCESLRHLGLEVERIREA